MSLKTTNCKLQQNEIGCTLADKGASTTSLRLLPRTSPPDSVEFLIECRFDRDPLSTKELYSTILDRAGLIRLQQAISAALALAPLSILREGHRYEPLLDPEPSVPPKQKDIDREDISKWLARARYDRATAPLNYPKACNQGVTSGSGWNCVLTNRENSTKEELIAEVARGVIGTWPKPRGGYVQWSASEKIDIVQAEYNERHPKKIGITKLHPYIAVYDCVIFFPVTVTKEKLIENAKQIAETWCPRAHVVWSATETIWPKLPKKDAP